MHPKGTETATQPTPPHGEAVLILGAGGREHALVRACLADAGIGRVCVAPGNAGMAREPRCQCLDLDPMDAPAIVAACRAQGIDWVIVGPEAPLAAGVADALRAAGVPVFGPGRDAAQLEASKAWSKAFMERHGVPAARSKSFTAIEPALDYLAQVFYPIVIKASGLAAGKGVVIAASPEEARQNLHAMLVEGRFGSSGSEVLIEDFLEGEELSVMVLVGGGSALVFPACQDHKRRHEGDQGPNTGGMGAYTPTALETPEVAQAIRSQILEPTLRGLEAEGIAFQGLLFLGVMLTREGPKLLEYNVRWGDPECQILMALHGASAVAGMRAAARGNALDLALPPSAETAVIVVLVAEGYPGTYAQGERIALPEALPEGVALVHAGTALDADGHLASAGGRVLGVVARAGDLATARARAHAAAEAIRWQGKAYRTDIGWRELERLAGD